ncbi:DUF421 domain-containing protein [Neobacillus sp. GCM10023253]|uniref:DUF421 domain-containing protein n=1 Tax=Neobacillus sp. GCM10023253 TaxID=3252644 RepID=UPI003613D95B
MPVSLEIIFRTLTAFIILWVFLHILGKQTIFQKTYHLFIATITMGTIAGNLAFNINIKFRYFILSFVIMGAVIFTLNTLTVKKHRYKEWIAGKPIFLIQEGKILEASLKKFGYSLDMLTQALRGKDIFNIEEVECAILEVSGSLSHDYDKDWFLAELKKRNVQVSEISYAVVGSKGNLYIDLFRDNSS